MIWKMEIGGPSRKVDQRKPRPSTRLFGIIGIVVATLRVQPEIDEHKVRHVRGNLTLHHHGIAPNDVLIVRLGLVALNYN